MRAPESHKLLPDMAGDIWLQDSIAVIDKHSFQFQHGLPRSGLGKSAASSETFEWTFASGT